MESVKHTMMEVYENMTSVEQSIADFFINNEARIDFSARNISRILYISNASLSRFAKKCGYKGYRELIYDYEKELQEQINEDSISELAKKVKYTYSSLLEEVFCLLNEEKVRQVAEMLSEHKRVLICGIGSSGYAAQEMAFRMMRLGLEIQAVTDSQVIQMAAAVAGEDCLMIAISLSGTTQIIVDSVHMAKSKGAGVVLITANKEVDVECDVILYTATSHNLDGGTAISPQFPILVLADIFYAYYFRNDTKLKSQMYQMTLATLKKKNKRIDG